MKLNLKVIPNSKKNQIIEEKEFIKVYVTKQAVNNKANKAVIDLLSEYFNIKKKDIIIINGEKSRMKIVEICKN